MEPRRPYLVRAIQQWAEDSGMTPQLLVDTTVDGVTVPVDYIKEDRIVLNVHNRAVRNLQMTNDTISFNARFGGTPHNISVPMRSVLAIYARENGQGMFFDSTDDEPPPPDGPPNGGGDRSLRVLKDGPGPASSGDGASKKPSLRVVK